MDFKLAKLDEPRVLLMMILVDDSGSKKKRSYKLASELTADEAVVIIQSYFRRMVARDRVQKMLHERAAVQIEARGARGHAKTRRSWLSLLPLRCLGEP